MRFIFIADLHLSRYGQDKIEDKTNLPERLHGIRNALYSIVEFCRNNEIQNIIIGGDILHGKSIIYSLAQSLLLDFIRDCSDIKFTVIDGNHDLSGKAKHSVSALKSLDNEPNVHRINDTSFHDKENDILYVPYSPDMISIIKQNSAKILISHVGLSEGVLSSGISVVSDLKKSDLVGKYDLVLLGHYHKPQEIIDNQISIYYVGSIIQLDWGEKNEEKRFLVVDTETGNIETHPTQGYRKYIEYEITDDNKEEIKQSADKIIKDGGYVKIVRKTDIDIDDLSKSFIIVDKIEKDVTDRGLTSSMSDKDKLTRYLEIRGIKEEKKEEYLKVGIDIIDKCEVNI